MEAMKPTLLTFSSPIEASDAGRRIISGQIVPFGAVGTTSVGPVIFERGSIAIPKPSQIKLLAQHNSNDPIGRAQSFQETPDGIFGTFKVSASSKGTDALLMASEDLISGLSVGVEVLASREMKNGTLVVSSANLKEVSLVEAPAFSAARVLEVIAAAGEDDMVEQTIEEQESELIDQISNAADQLKTLQVIEQALEDQETQSSNESEAPMSQDTAATTEAAAVAAEASRPVIKASSAYGDGTTRVRHGITSMGKYTEHKVKAALGNDDSKLWVSAAEDRSLLTASDTLSNNGAFNPIQYLANFVSNTNFGRPAIDAVTRQAAPASGLQINIPAMITSAGGGSSTAPTVAANTIGDAPSDTSMTSAYTTMTLARYAGQQTIDLSLIERSDPVFFDQLAIQLQRAYLLATDAAMIAALTAGGTQAATTAGTSAGLISFISTEAPAAYAGSSYFAENIITNTNWWSTLIGSVDTTGRPIYNAINPYNAAGQSAPTSIKGNVLGLSLFVDKNVTAGLVDESAFIVAPETALWVESPEAFFSVNVVSSMAIQTAIYGYGVGKVLIPAGVRRFNLT